MQKLLFEIVSYFKRIGLVTSFFFILFLLDPFQKGFIGGYLLTLVIYLKKDFWTKRLDVDFIILQAFAITYGIFSIIDPNIYTQTVIFYGVFPPVLFMLGRFVMSRLSTTEEVFYTFFAVGLLYSFSALVSVTLNLRTGGYGNFERSIPFFWNGGKPIKATLMAAYLTFNMCTPALFLVKLKKYNLQFKVIAGLIFLQSLLCVFRLGSRTQLAIFLITTLLTLVFIISKQSISKNVRLIIALTVALGLILVYAPIDADAEYLSTLGQRLQKSDNTGSAGGRTELWSSAINYFIEHPLGWKQQNTRFAHNLWLDVARVHGIIPFVLLVVFSLITFKNTVRAIRLRKKSMLVNTVFFAFVFAANLMFFVEPVTEGVFSFFLVYCFFQGAIKEYILKLGHTPNIQTTT